jgi:hypothetical protein
MGEAYSTNWGEKHAYRLLVRKPERKGPLGIPCGLITLRWMSAIAWIGVDWIVLAEERYK